MIEVLAKVYAETHTAPESCRPELRLPRPATSVRQCRACKWMNEQFQQRVVEPHGGLRRAMNYMLKHWSELTLFLRQAGAPLDNNVVERALKRAIRHRKNSLFYKTLKGAEVGDIYMSLIHTCQLGT